MEVLNNLAFPTVALLIGSIMLLLAIAKRVKTKLIEFPEIKTPQQRLQLGIAGIVLIIASLVLQIFSPTAQSGSIESTTLTAAESTISALETQLSFSLANPTSTGIPATTPTEASTGIPTITTPTNQTPPTQAPSVTPTPLTTADFCVNFYSVIVRDGPGVSYPQKSILYNPYNISDPVCLRFDYRVPDNTWARIAPEQENSDYNQHKLGWIQTNQLRPNDIGVLRLYIPDGVQNGKYCPMNRNGIYVRSCPNNSCNTMGTLYLPDCLFIDARSADKQWVRISSEQEDDKYTPYTGYWVSAYFVAPFDLSSEWSAFYLDYLNILPIATPFPTPGG